MVLPALAPEQANFFAKNGFLVLPHVLTTQELVRLQEATADLIAHASPEAGPDYLYGTAHKGGRPVLRRIEYVVDKCPECRVLLGHPFILRVVQQLIGSDFIPTWDSMVIKLPYEGIAVPWHRDAGTDCVGDTPIFNVDFYLDEADEDTCVWAIPGSHTWPSDRVEEFLAQHHEADRHPKDFRNAGAIPIFMQPGDVLLHNILVLHGSPHNSSPSLRRVLYYEFRAAHVEERLGPHVPAYIPLKQRVLLRCIELRSRAHYVPSDEARFEYQPPAPYGVHTWHADEDPPTFRYAHEEYWRSKQ
ncbi:MAG: phytanoyl-CoA dioxygenase family protein [Chthonomonadales bacterium]